MQYLSIHRVFGSIKTWGLKTLDVLRLNLRQKK